MKRGVLLIPVGLIENPDAHASIAPYAIAGWQALWHPRFLAADEALPAWSDISEPPGDHDARLVVPRPTFDVAGAIIKNDLTARGGAVARVEAEDTSVDGPARLAKRLGAVDVVDGRADPFFALAYAHLGLEILFEHVGRENPLDAWTFFTRVKEAAETAVSDDATELAGQLNGCFEQLLAARQTLYPAMIGLLDLALYHPGLAAADIMDRRRRRSFSSMIITGQELERLAADKPDALLELKQSLQEGDCEILGGPYTDRPLALLPAESRYWELARGAATYERILERTVDGFASRASALSADLPRLLMKFGFRHAIHGCFDGARIPYFKEPKLHWTAGDGSVIEAVCKPPRDASSSVGGLAVFVDLAKTIQNDRAATIMFAHWAGVHAAWMEWFLRIHDHGEIFGRFSSLGDYFINNYTAERPTVTHVDEYASRQPLAASSRGERDALSRSIQLFRRRGEFEVIEGLAAMAQIASGQTVDPSPSLEEAIELDASDVDVELAAATNVAAERMERIILSGASAAAGYLLINTCGFPRRACVELPGAFAGAAPGVQIRAFQPIAGGTAAIVDTPAFGYAWLPSEGEAPPPVSKAAPLASGKRLRNEFLEVEIDAKTGGMRGLWQVRTGYSRLAAQLAHSAPGSRQVADKIEVVASGPAFGEIVSSGSLRSPADETLATFRMQTRVWFARPFVDIVLDLEPAEALSGAPLENYIAMRWAWPDEKTDLSIASGTWVEGTQLPELETPSRIELRERRLSTTILPHGLPIHRRLSPRMADTLLLAPGERRRQFHFTLAMDLAHPWMAVYDKLWPIVVRKTETGPPTLGATGWIASLGVGNVLCTRLEPLEDPEPGVAFHLTETSGRSTHLDLKLCRAAQSARLVNAKRELIYDLYASDTGAPVDLSPHEFLRVEVKHARG